MTPYTRAGKEGKVDMKTYYQVYRDGYWHTSTLDKAEAISLAVALQTAGHTADIRVEGRSILGPYIDGTPRWCRSQVRKSD